MDIVCEESEKRDKRSANFLLIVSLALSLLPSSRSSRHMASNSVSRSWKTPVRRSRGVERHLARVSMISIESGYYCAFRTQ
jgi:hypothetical protein